MCINFFYTHFFFKKKLQVVYKLYFIFFNACSVLKLVVLKMKLNANLFKFQIHALKK